LPPVVEFIPGDLIISRKLQVHQIENVLVEKILKESNRKRLGLAVARGLALSEMAELVYRQKRPFIEPLNMVKLHRP
jgi:hypothetical protein